MVRARSRFMGRERGLGQRQGLGSAPGVEQETRVLTAKTLRATTFPAERFFAGGDGTLEPSLGVARVTNLAQHAGEIAEDPRRIGMLGAERLLADRQRAFVERTRPGKVPLRLKQKRKVVEADRRLGMLAPEHLLTDRQRTFFEWPRPRKITLGLKQHGKVVEE